MYMYIYILKKTIMDQTSWYSSCVRLMCSNIACFICVTISLIRCILVHRNRLLINTK